jgi:hypothetical protein
MATITVRWPPSARVYIRGGEAASGHDNSTRKHTTFSVAYRLSLSHLLRAQTVWERKPPKSPFAERHLHGCASDQVFGERTRDCSLRPALIKFLVAGAVRGTALRTSVCVDCVRLHRTYTRDVSCEWRH